jgi:acetyl esterase/lipase
MRTLLFWFVRLCIAPALSAGVPVAFQRRWGSFVALFLPGASGTRAEAMELAGVPTLRIDTVGAQRQRSIVFLHGGGYVMGGAGSHRKLAAHIGKAARARVWLPEYRLAPEHSQPAALKDALAVYAALLEEGQDPAQLALVGDSAGGGLALATALAARDAGLPLPGALVLLSPWVDLGLGGPSIATHSRRDPMVKASWLQACAKAYRGVASDRDAACSPLFANLHGLPPMLIQVGTEEILLSDAERLAEKARAAGVRAELQRHDGLWHVFQLHAGMLREADAAVAAIGAFVEAEALTMRNAA